MNRSHLSVNAGSVMELDAAEAWSPFEPGVHGEWDVRRAAHLVRRAAFGGTAKFVAELAAVSPAEAVSRLITGDGDNEAHQAESDALARTILASGDPKRLASWWIYELMSTQHPLRERLTVFWHGHFATGGDKVTDAEALYRQNRLLRDEALGNFARMTHGIAKDPAMLVYLDSATNRKAHPNENFARELMELFCLGEGNYTEADVQQLARCFTGWEIRQGKFRFNRYQHDEGEKTIFDKTSEFADAESVDWVLEHPSAATFIAGKLYRLLVADEPLPSNELLAPLAQQLRDSKWEIEPVVRTILQSRLFLSDESFGRKVRSPVDLAIGLLRTFEGSANSSSLSDELNQMGMGLFFPPNVKGWDGGRAWINASTLLARANGIGRLLSHESTRLDRRAPGEYLTQRASNPEALLQIFENEFLAVPLSPAAKQRLLEVGASDGNEGRRAITLLHATAAQAIAQLA